MFEVLPLCVVLNLLHLCLCVCLCVCVCVFLEELKKKEEERGDMVEFDLCMLVVILCMCWM